MLDCWPPTRYGVPQHRIRLFLVGFRDRDYFDWPPANAAVSTTLRDAIGDLPPVQGGQRNEVVSYSGPPVSDLQKRLRRGVPADLRLLVHDHITRAVRPDDAEAFALLPPGGTYAQLPDRLQRYRSDIFRDKYKRIEWNI